MAGAVGGDGGDIARRREIAWGKLRGGGVARRERMFFFRIRSWAWVPWSGWTMCVKCDARRRYFCINPPLSFFT
jgi:hypothetical protein